MATCGKPTQACIQKSIKVSLIAVKQAWISKSIKVSLIAVNNIIVVTYYSKCHRLSLSLIAVNEKHTLPDVERHVLPDFFTYYSK